MFDILKIRYNRKVEWGDRMLEQLACNQGRRDEVPNIALAKRIVEENDSEGISEIVQGVKGKNKDVANDCIKVLYEVGEREPELIRQYVMTFLELLLSKNNRLVWGAMTALAEITQLESRTIYKHLEIVRSAYRSGSVITRDQSITVFAKLCLIEHEHENELFLFLMDHLKHCRPKEVAQHAERIALCINRENYKVFEEVLTEREPYLAASQVKRNHSLLKKLTNKIEQ